MPIVFEQVSHIYPIDAKNVRVALNNISLSIELGKVTAIIGTTGSGKSTFVQHLNALLLPSDGKVEVEGFTLTKDSKQKLKDLRKRVGLVFQFPEYQLFEETVAKDIAFGPKNFGVDEKEIEERIDESLRLVQLDPSFKNVNPLDLSGGQKRRVAIAGVLAMRPDILVLDEPTAGLDPIGTKDMMDLFLSYNKEQQKTVFIVTHDMDNVMNYCDDVIVLHNGTLVYYGDKTTFFNSSELMEKAEVLPPSIVQLRDSLIDKGFPLSKECDLSFESIASEIAKVVKP